jgi:serine/threonine protein kinase
LEFFAVKNFATINLAITQMNNEEKIAIVASLNIALSQLHHVGIVHNDIKDANIVFENVSNRTILLRNLF